MTVPSRNSGLQTPFRCVAAYLSLRFFGPASRLAQKGYFGAVASAGALEWQISDFNSLTRDELHRILASVVKPVQIVSVALQSGLTMRAAILPRMGSVG